FRRKVRLGCANVVVGAAIDQVSAGSKGPQNVGGEGGEVDLELPKTFRRELAELPPNIRRILKVVSRDSNGPTLRRQKPVRQEACKRGLPRSAEAVDSNTYRVR